MFFVAIHLMISFVEPSTQPAFQDCNVEIGLLGENPIKINSNPLLIAADNNLFLVLQNSVNVFVCLFVL